MSIVVVKVSFIFRDRKDKNQNFVVPCLDVITILAILKSMWLKTVHVSVKKNHTYVWNITFNLFAQVI